MMVVALVMLSKLVILVSSIEFMSKLHKLSLSKKRKADSAILKQFRHASARRYNNNYKHHQQLRRIAAFLWTITVGIAATVAVDVAADLVLWVWSVAFGY